MVLASVAQRPLLALDNHHFVELYWVAAIVTSRFATEPDAVVHHSARLVIGLAFAFGTLWQVRSPDLLWAAFLEFVVLTDVRLLDVLWSLGWQEPDTARETVTSIQSGWRPETNPTRACCYSSHVSRRVDV